SRMLVVGSLGFLLLATGWRPLYIVGVVLASGLGWGVSGLVFLAATRISPERPAGAAGRVVLHGALGGVIGPVILGAVADHSYRVAWTLAAVAVLISSMMLRSIAIGNSWPRTSS